jgi:hypothetical protein
MSSAWATAASLSTQRPHVHKDLQHMQTPNVTSLRVLPQLARPNEDPQSWGKRGLSNNDLFSLLGPIQDTCERINASETSHEEFLERFEQASRPCIIQVAAVPAIQPRACFFEGGALRWNEKGMHVVFQSC